jgi:hypothetical protein
MNTDLRVFVSSTYSDLRGYREAVASALRRLTLIPVRLEDFGPPDRPPLAAALHAIDSSDIVVVLVAWRLGYIPPETDKSLVELEYERALKDGKPTLCFLLDEDQPWPPSQIDSDYSGVTKFRDRLRARHLVSTFTTPEDLAAKVAVAVAQYSREVRELLPELPLPAAPAPPEASTTEVLSELKGLRAEVSVLQQLVAEGLRRPASTSIDVGGGSTMSPADFLGPASPIDPNRCFVIMPYSQDWSGAVERIILEVCTDVGLEFEIAKNMPSRFVPHDIWRGITAAGVIVADLSGANPNVTYEVGLADVAGKDVVLIAQQAEVPFDFQAQRLILYENSLPGSLILREELKDRLQRYKAKRGRIGGQHTQFR